MNAAAAFVTAVSSSTSHGPLKANRDQIRLLAGLGVEGDAHMGERVQHRSRARTHPELPNLRQVHLIASELHDELGPRGFTAGPGQMGENVTTRGIDLLALPAGTRLGLAAEALIELTGLRNPCRQLDGVQAGLMAATLERGADGDLVRRCGVMAVVVRSGEVRPGDAVAVKLPAEPHRALSPV